MSDITYPTKDEKLVTGLVSIQTQCPQCQHVYEAQMVDGDRRVMAERLQAAEARADEQAAVIEQLSQGLATRDVQYHAAQTQVAQLTRVINAVSKRRQRQTRRLLFRAWVGGVVSRRRSHGLD